MTRPAVGVLSALAVCVLVEAGFSERFVKDAFGRAEGIIAQPP